MIFKILGRVLAVLTGDSIELFEVSDDMVSDLAPVRGGIGYSLRGNRLFTVTRKLFALAKLSNGEILKRIPCFDNDDTEVPREWSLQQNLSAEQEITSGSELSTALKSTRDGLKSTGAFHLSSRPQLISSKNKLLPGVNDALLVEIDRANDTGKPSKYSSPALSDMVTAVATGTNEI